MCRSSAIVTLRMFAIAAGVVLAVGTLVRAQWQGSGQGHGRPVYQRQAFERSSGHGKRRNDKFGHAPFFQSPQVNASWFQRPYPYHLDYYRMRYGGSYAPYFGNLYGPPQVVTAPPYYGPYYGNYVNPTDGALGMPLESPLNMAPQANMESENNLPAPPRNATGE